ncbi:MAG: hypothetical protein N2V73_05145 [Candidatus Methanospirare jalkutatii]|nr:hypothetical protein [Candidatus Methanospirare jalkutatii]
MKRTSVCRGICILLTLLCLMSMASPMMPSLLLPKNASEVGCSTEPLQMPTESPPSEETQSMLPTPCPSPCPPPLSSPSPAALTTTPTQNQTPTPQTLMPNQTPPSIVSFAPENSSVSDIKGASRTFFIALNQIMNITWMINGTIVQTNTSVINASYTGKAFEGVWNVSAFATNRNGTVSRTWIWNVSALHSNQTRPLPPSPAPSPVASPTPKPTPSPLRMHIEAEEEPSPPFYIFGWVSYKNGEKCYNPSVRISNLNTGESVNAETSANTNFFHAFINVSVGNIIQFNVTDGTQYNCTNHTITQNESKIGVLNINITLETPPQTDLAVTELYAEPHKPIFGASVNVTARIENEGNATNSTLIFYDEYDEKNVSISKFWNVPNSTNDTIILPGAIKIRLHFAEIAIQDGGFVRICNDTGTLINNFTANKTDFWTNWSFGDEIRIESHEANFTIDKYEMIFAEETVKLECGELKSISAIWNTSALFNGEDIASGNHTIRAEIVPVAGEVNKENNNKSIEVEVKPLTSFDIMVTDLSIDKQTLFDGDIVNITATVTNNGSENVSFSLLFKADENEIGSVTVDEMMPGKKREISIRWNATLGKHNITVIADPKKKIWELNESNNEKSVLVLVNVSKDFAITHISLFNASSGEPCNKNIFFGDELLINFSLNITNLANNGDYVEVALLIDNNTVNKRNISFAENIRNISISRDFKWTVNKTGNHTITVCVDPENRTVEFNESNNNKSLNVNASMGFDFSVVNVEMPSEAKMGDVVRINATVASEGMRKAHAPVEFYDRKRINLSASVEGVEIRKVKGNTVIRLPLDSKMVDNITIPNARKIRVHFSHVDLECSSLKICGKDFVEDLSKRKLKNYWTEWVIGDTIRIESQLLEGSFSIDMYEALLSTSNVSTDKSKADIYAELNLSMQEMGWALVGTHNITVKVNVTDDNITNNEREKEIINVRPSLDFALLNITFLTPKELLLNQTVKINVTAANFGTESGTAVLSVLCDNITVNETEITLNTNAKKTIEMGWIANTSNGGAGYHDIAVKIDPDNTFVEMNEENNTLHEHIFVNGTDLVVVSMEIPCGVSIFGVPCYCSENYTINVTIANIGALNASNISIILKDGSGEGNKSGRIFNISHIPYLNSGDHVNISVNWTPEFFGKHTITANVSAEYTDAAGMIPYDKTDNNETNNEIFVNVSVKPEYDLEVESVRVHPEEVKEGENVTINATIINWGLENCSVNVSFYINYTDFIGSGDERFIEVGRNSVYVPAKGGRKNASITWKVNVSGGEHTIYAVVDPENRIPEWPDEFIKIGETIILRDTKVRSNNVNSCILHVRLPQLNIINLSSEPSEPVIESNVSVITLINNSGNETASSTVRFYMEKHLSINKTIYHSGIGGGKNIYYWLQSIPEKLPIRVHFKYIEINSSIKYIDRASEDNFVRVYVDNNPVNLIVKSKEVAQGQPIMLSEINFDSPCGKCMERNETHGICIYRRWEDVWTEWRSGKEIKEEVMANLKKELGEYVNLVNISVKIDKFQVFLGSKEIILPAGGESTCNISWNASSTVGAEEGAEEGFIPLRAGENYTLIANVEDKIMRKEVYLHGTDLAVTKLLVNDTYYDGDVVNIAARVSNLGLKNATEFIVNFTVDKKTINSTSIDHLEAGNTINISVPWIAKYNGSNYTIEVEINPLKNFKFEEKDDNNDQSKDVQVKSSRDFSVVNLSFKPSEPAIDENVTLNATINVTNYANRGGTFNVSFYIDEIDREHEICNHSIEFQNGTGTVYAECVWDLHPDVVRNASFTVAGDHNIIIVADPTNETIELNESNNASTWKIHVKAPELTVTNITFEPDKNKINKSEGVNISVTVANYGDLNASASLVVYDCMGSLEEANIKVCDSSLHPDVNNTEWINITDAVAMKLYLDLDIKNGVVYIGDREGIKIRYYENFHGWSPWIFDSNVTVGAIRSTENGSILARVSKIYYMKRSERINEVHIICNKTEEKFIPVCNWTLSAVGEHFIVAIIDPENSVIEYDELNNSFARYITVNTADLTIRNIELRRLNGTKIGENNVIRDNDVVRIIASISNTGAEHVNNFAVRVLVDDNELFNEMKNASPGEVINVSTDWVAEVGTHVIKIEVDYDDKVRETNETNNIVAIERYIYGAKVSGNVSWESLGLHGLNGTILFDPSQPYDEDDVNITAVINNTGNVNATNFSVSLLFDYKPDIYPFENKQNKFFKGRSKSNATYYDSAICIYIYIDTHNKTLLDRNAYGVVTWHQIFVIYDRNNTEVARTDRSCWIRVPGDKVKIERFEDNEAFPYNISFYPIYKDNLIRNLTVRVNSSISISKKVRDVTVGNHTVLMFIDPEGKVPEDVDNKSDNVVVRKMTVLPTRDFTVNYIANKTISDDNVEIIANVSNIGLRNGTTKALFVDYEYENRICNYFLVSSDVFNCLKKLSKSCSDVFNQSSELNLSYLPVSPNEILSIFSEYERLTIIHRPGVDAIKLNFSWIYQYDADPSGKPPGEIHIYNESGEETRPDDWAVAGWGPQNTEHINNIWIPGDTVYIYTKNADFKLDRYTTMRVFHEENVTLNASVKRNESKNITAIWNATPGNHTITVIMDPDDEISEINETNNAFALPLMKAMGDIAITNITISPQHPKNGDNVTITVNIKNKGSESVNVTADLWMIVMQDNITSAPPNDWNISTGERSIPIGEETVRVKRIMYVKRLNHTNLSLAPYQSENVSATWKNISVSGNPEYVVKAIVDPMDEIKERNESNNDMSKEIILCYPDLTIAGFQSPTRKDENAYVLIRNIGADNASDFAVKLELTRHEKNPSTIMGGSLNITSNKSSGIIKILGDEGVSEMKIHFASIEIASGGYVHIYGKDGKRVYDT